MESSSIIQDTNRKSKPWTEMRHTPSKRTDVHNLIRRMLENELKVPANPHKPIVNLGLGMTSLK